MFLRDVSNRDVSNLELAWSVWGRGIVFDLHCPGCQVCLVAGGVLPLTHGSCPLEIPNWSSGLVYRFSTTSYITELQDFLFKTHEVFGSRWYFPTCFTFNPACRGDSIWVLFFNSFEMTTKDNDKQWLTPWRFLCSFPKMVLSASGIKQLQELHPGNFTSVLKITNWKGISFQLWLCWISMSNFRCVSLSMLPVLFRCQQEPSNTPPYEGHNHSFRIREGHEYVSGLFSWKMCKNLSHLLSLCIQS